MNPKVNTIQMADSIGLSTRQVLKYLKRLQELGKIARVGGRKRKKSHNQINCIKDDALNSRRKYLW